MDPLLENLQDVVRRSLTNDKRGFSYDVVSILLLFMVRARSLGLYNCLMTCNQCNVTCLQTEAIESLHSQKIVHGNIKTSSFAFAVREKGNEQVVRLVLYDFESAKKLDSATGSKIQKEDVINILDIAMNLLEPQQINSKELHKKVRSEM